MDIKKIAKLAKNDKFAIKKHAAIRMRQRLITVDDIKEALMSAQIIETYEDDYPFSSCLLLGYSGEKSLHIVSAISNIDDILLIITAYRPSIDEWLPGFVKRRTK